MKPPAGHRCLSSMILTPLNGNVKMSPHERKDVRVEGQTPGRSMFGFVKGFDTWQVRTSRAKARVLGASSGTAKAVPFPKSFLKRVLDDGVDRFGVDTQESLEDFVREQAATARQANDFARLFE